MFNQVRNILCALAVLVISATSPAWSGTDLIGVGATFPYPIYSKWFDAYHKMTGTAINYQSLGSGAGIQQLKARTADFGASDAPLSNDDLKTMPARVAHIPTVAGSVVLTYNIEGIGNGLRLTPEILSGIYLGKITKWNDRAITAANPKLRFPKQPIVVVHRSDGSGTSYIFTNYLSAVNKEWKSTVGAGKSVSWPAGIGGKGNEGVTALVKQTPGAIGYVELAYTVQNHLPAAIMRNQAGHYIKASIDSTVAAAAGAVAAMKKDVRTVIVNSSGKNAYPIAGFTYILVYTNQDDPAKAKALCNFLDWAIHDGQKMAKSLLYAPLPAKMVRINEAALKSIRSRGKRVL
ncbi:MAG: phosphate ABC transporter substrate-binding protein PstS [Armatimonadetes bacterium]|nr:phosphate ABC transporter substrate-binding protein PstS [Armatimonadota bacterium]